MSFARGGIGSLLQGTVKQTGKVEFEGAIERRPAQCFQRLRPLTFIERLPYWRQRGRLHEDAVHEAADAARQPEPLAGREPCSDMGGDIGLQKGEGARSDVDGASLATAALRFRAAGLKNACLQIAPGPRAAAFALKASAMGMKPLARTWVKFSRGAVSAPMPSTSLDIAEVKLEGAMVFARAVVAGFGIAEKLAPWLAGIVGREGRRASVARDGGAVVGGAAMFVDDGRAWLGIGAVQAAARRRGGQAGLLARRIADGLAQGARWFATETGKPLPGESHPSFSNIQRAGFTNAYERANWTL